jgi:hypothetical protein
MTKSISQSLLQEIFIYDDGELLWAYDRAPRAKKGSVAGTFMNQGYKGIKLSGKTYLASRLIYIYHYGDIPENLVIDHIDGNPKNNRLSNLRLLNITQNCWNTRKSKGFHKLPSGNFRVEITANGEKHQLGVFGTEEEASFAYLQAKAKLHFIEGEVL